MEIIFANPEKRRREQNNYSFQNATLAALLQKRQGEEVTAAMLAHIWDYDCEYNNDGSNSRLIKVYATFEQAQQDHVVYNREPDEDMEDCHMNKAIRLFLQPDTDKGGDWLVLRVEEEWDVVLDGISLARVCNSLPIDEIVAAAGRAEE